MTETATQTTHAEASVTAPFRAEAQLRHRGAGFPPVIDRYLYLGGEILMAEEGLALEECPDGVEGAAHELLETFAQRLARLLRAVADTDG